MSKSALSILTLAFGLPAAAALWQGQDMARFFAAEAEPTTLLQGCGDVPEAVALAEELRDRALRIERYMVAMDDKKAELATSQASLREYLAQLRAIRDSQHRATSGESEAVRSDIEKLVAVYDRMKPAEAAAVLTNLPADFAAEILMRVQPENGARIIANVEPRQAALLTAQMGARSVRNP
ncbi:MotE family protein [Paracoccus sp. (in: a-proteobacteria)]|uniref:MotE family protein n=1 Tax=Paracoccus sp. TaxID=267 RepID=UPI0026DF40DA|nr:hypothetical protein [Paracoccus sp. (in: a-proteobacteria)]MDO5648393.1 hypothetical protein [Paracoccus sp. (in: a-proteobacteria)]